MGRPGQTHREVGTQSQGIFGRSTIKTARLPDQVRTEVEGVLVKANLARFTTAIMLLASMALSLGAGMRWWE
jgi:hypothetical protein